MRLRPLTGTPTEPAPTVLPRPLSPPVLLLRQPLQSCRFLPHLLPHRAHTMQALAPTTQAFATLAPTPPAPASLSPLLNSLYRSFRPAPIRIMFNSQSCNLLRAESVASDAMTPQTYMRRTSLFRLFYTGCHTQGTPITAEDRLLFAMFDSQACNMLRALSMASTMAPQPFMRRISLFRSTLAATLKAQQ